MVKQICSYLQVFISYILIESYCLAEEPKSVYIRHPNKEDFHLYLLDTVNEAVDFNVDCPIVYGFPKFDIWKPLFTSLFRYPYRPWMMFSPPLFEDTPVLPNENITLTYGYPWNYDPFSMDIGRCALFVLYFQNKSDLEQIVEFIPTISKINWGRHYFLLINEKVVNGNEGFVEDILLNSTVTSVMKYKIMPVRNQDELEVYTACFYCNGGYPKIVPLRFPNSRQKLIYMRSLYPDFTTNMNNTYLSGVFVEEYSKLGSKKTLQSNENYYIGIAYLYLVSEALNFNYNVNVIDIGLSGAFNRRLEDGMWVGLAGDVLYGKADFALTNPLAELMGFISYSISLVDTRFIIYASKPKTYFSSWTVIKAFAIWLWAAIFLSVSIATIVFGYSLEKEMVKQSTFSRYLYAFHFILFSVIGCPLSLPNRTASRLLLTFWLLSCIIISFSYQSNFTSIMTIPSKVEVPSTYEEILEMNYKYGGSSFTNAFFQFITLESESPHVMEIRDNIINFDTIKDCFEASLKTKLVCITVPEIGVGDMYSFLDDNYFPQLDPKMQSGTPASACSVFRKGFVGFDRYNWAIRRYRETGIFQFWEQEILRRSFSEGLRNSRSNIKKFENKVRSSTKWNQLHLSQVSAPFIIFIFGVLLAGLVFVFEVASNC